MLQVVRVTRTEFELETGDVFPLIPPLLTDMTLDEFQVHYEFAVEVVQSGGPVGGYDSDPSDLGC